MSAEPMKISTSKYKTEGKVDVDGHIWMAKLPGAGTEMRLNQAFRGSKLWSARTRLLEKKIDDGTITEQELDKLEEYSEKFDENERVIYGFFTSMFRDDTEDNSEVKQWVNDTPTYSIQAAFEDMTKQAAEKKSNEANLKAGVVEAQEAATKTDGVITEATDGPQEPSASPR